MILEGIKIAESLNEKLKERISQNNDYGKPKLVIIQVGKNSSSEIYINNKVNKASEVGIITDILYFNENEKLEDIVNEIEILNNDKSVSGIIIQLPLPDYLKDKTNFILNQVSPDKDVDGFTNCSLGSLVQNSNENFIPATPKGIITLLDHYKINLKSKNCLVIGSSIIVGRPLALILLNKGAFVSLANINTTNLDEKIKNSDIIFLATGCNNLIKKEFLNKNQIIIDVGFSIKKGKCHGDCDHKIIKDYVKSITPVPGGVGPMTVNALLDNTYNAYRNLKRK